ncbi:calcium-binding protein [Shimia sp. SDUM112013]|uniref:calcium-binding protein n=1 Tax=Shimia sp. SDUM112013 TaxID=3136160 RepID=UPI0032ED85C4
MPRITGSSADDRILGTDRADTIEGLAGNDTLQGGMGEDLLDGGDGIDLIRYAFSTAPVQIDLRDNSLFGGSAEGDSVISIERVRGSDFDDMLLGDNAENQLIGGAGDDTLQGRDGRDKLDGGGGRDSLDGGLGPDWLSYYASNAGVTINLATGQASGGDAEGDVFLNFENLRGSQHDDRLTGDSGDNRMFGAEGADTLTGGVGIDWLTYATSDAAVTVHLGTGATSGGHAAGDVISEFENLRGSQFDDHLSGDGLANFLSGADGDDTLVGGDGNDTFIGGQGADSMDGGNGIDLVTYRSATIFRFGAIVDTRSGTASGVAEGDRFTSVEYFVGTNVADSFVLGSEDNRVHGLDGDDFIDTGNGNDTLIGGAGRDFLHGGDGNDTALYITSDAGVTINMQIGGNSGGHAEGDTLSWIENVTGSAFDDSLTGDRLGNRLAGHDGDDTLAGGAGADTLRGGDGADSFVFVPRAENTTQQGAENLALTSYITLDRDLIMDFQRGSDTLVFALDYLGALQNTNSVADLGLTSETDAAFAFYRGNLFHVSYADAGAFANGVVDVQHLARLHGIDRLDITDFTFV